MKNKTTLLITITLEELSTIVRESVEVGLSSISEKQNQSQNPINFISRKQVSEMLGVCQETIYSWQRKGILKGYKIGNRVRYSLSEVESVITKRETNV